MTYDLSELRDQLDDIDNKLIALLAVRFEVTHKVGLYKKANNLPAVDKQREAEQFERIKQKALKNGLNPDFAKRFLRMIIDEVVDNHEALRAKN